MVFGSDTRAQGLRARVHAAPLPPSLLPLRRHTHAHHRRIDRPRNTLCARATPPHVHALLAHVAVQPRPSPRPLLQRPPREERSDYGGLSIRRRRRGSLEIPPARETPGTKRVNAEVHP